MRAVAAIEPKVSLAHLSNRALPYEFDRASQTVLGATLVAHLRDDFVFGGRFAHHARFLNGASERLFAINVLAAFHRGHCGDRMRVIGSRDDDGVNFLFHFIQHPAKILEDFCPGMFPKNVARARVVHVAKRDNLGVAVGDIVEITSALTTDPDSGNPQFVVCFISERPPHIGQDEQSGGRGGVSEKSTARESGFHQGRVQRGGIFVYPGNSRQVWIDLSDQPRSVGGQPHFESRQRLAASGFVADEAAELKLNAYQLERAPSAAAFCEKVRRSPSALTWIGSPSWKDPLRISSASGSSSERSTARRIGRAPYCGS